MKLFNKEKGIILGALNAILIIWILVAIVIVVSSATNVLVKDYVYTYEEFKLTNCDFQYETEEDCKDTYVMYNLDMKNYNLSYLRSIIIGISNCILVSGVLFILNKEKKNN